MAKGLSADDGAQAVAVPRSTLYRWEQQAEPRSKRPRRMRPKSWTPELVEAVEALLLDHPMWGRAKIGPLLRREGFTVSDATVGRIIAHLVKRRAIEPVPILRRRKGGAARAWRRKYATAAQRPQAAGPRPASSDRYPVRERAARPRRQADHSLRSGRPLHGRPGLLARNRHLGRNLPQQAYRRHALPRHRNPEPAPAEEPVKKWVWAW